MNQNIKKEIDCKLRHVPQNKNLYNVICIMIVLEALFINI